MGFGILKKRKTYVTATLAILGFAGAYVVGDASLATTAQGIVTALLGITIRHGIG